MTRILYPGHFLYDDMVSTYGTDDFSTVEAVNVGDRGTMITVTKVAIDLSGDGLSDFAEDIETEAETEEDSAEAEETEAENEEVTETTAEAEETAAAEDEAPKKAPIVPIAIVGVVIIAGVVVFFVIKSRNKYY